MFPPRTLPAEGWRGRSPRLLIINNMPAFYRTAPFDAMLTEFSRRTGGVGLVAYQVRRDSHRRGEWFFTPDSDFPYVPYFSSADTNSSSTRTAYPMRVDWTLWRKFRPDYVFTAGWDSPLSLTAAAYSRLRGADLGVWVESNPSTSRHRGGAADVVRRRFLRSAAFAVVPSSASALHVSMIAGHDLPCVRLKNPVTCSRLSDRTASTEKRMVFIGDLSERKGFDHFAAALGVASDRGWSAVAYGRDVEGLASLAPPNVNVRPATELAHIIPHLRASDVLVIPSRMDPAPLTFSEGLALGLRTLVSDQIAYGEDAEALRGCAKINPADPAAVVTAAETLWAGPRPDTSLGSEVSPEFFAAEVLEAFGL